MRHCYVLRVFTRGEEGGNRVGVVPDSSGLNPSKMQLIASELGFSETVFLSWRDAQAAPDAHIFTRTAELPFAGVPLVGAGWVLSVLGPGADRLRCGIGEVVLTVDGEKAWIETALDQAVELIDGPVAMSQARGLPPARIIRRVMMPLPYLVFELKSPTAVAEARPGPAAFGAGEMLYLCAQESEHAYRARFFAPEFGVTEDPATGSAAVALAAVLQAAGQEEGEVQINQGEETGNPSTIHLRWSGGRARIGGSVRKDEVRVLDY